MIANEKSIVKANEQLLLLLSLQTISGQLSALEKCPGAA
jgi:hypothetical protein